MTTVRLGSRTVTVPVLAGPVGRPSPAYPGINQAAGVRQIEQQFTPIAEINRVRLPGQRAATAQEQAMANAAALWPTDRIGAISGFQRAARAASAEETRDAVILPDGKTWTALFTYGEIARELDAVRDRAANPQDNIHTGTFDHAAFQTAVGAGFAADRIAGVRYNAGSLPDWDRLLGYLERDPRMIDIRWMAYILATAYWEGAHVVTTGRRPDGRAIRQWRTIVPIEETGHGAGRAYHLPVKVERISATLANITEQDGERFEVTTTGHRSLTRGARMGSPAADAATQTYQRAAGTPLAFFGRGYVQLTWWSNYAAAGVSIGRGLDLLFDPALALDPAIAYALMGHSMLTGDGFANGRTLRQYIMGPLCNYAGARALVNANDPQPAIVAAAGVFEAALRGARR